jgi:hypothetical protein
MNINANSTTLRVAALVLVVLTACQGRDQGSTRNPQLFPRVDDALAVIESNCKISIGFEMSVNDADEGPVKVDPRGTDVVNIFNNIVEQRPAYEWTFENSVYDVYPKDKQQSLSAVVIRKFTVRDITPADASRMLTDLPEVHNWLSERGLTRQEFYTGARWKSHERMSFELENVTFRTVLNELTRRVGDTRWTVSRYGQKKEFIGIYF